MTQYAAHADFHALRERLRLRGLLETRTGLRIGSGGGGELDASDLPVLRDADGYPLIPGSSIKGVLRSTAEALVRGSQGELTLSPLWSCDPITDEADGRGPTCGQHGVRGETRAQALSQTHCTICQLFGSRVIASHVRFSDAMLRNAETLKRAGRIPIEVRDGVAIDRDVRAAAAQKKFNFEVVAPGTQFELEVFVENPEDWLMGLLTVAFDQLSEGFTAIGGFTSRGLGRVSIEWLDLTRCDARELLEGSKPRVYSSSELESAFQRWRGALGRRIRGDH